MKNYFLILTFLIFVSPINSQIKTLDSKVYDTWRGVKSILVSTDGNAVFTEYENYTDKKILEIKIGRAGIVKEIKGGEEPKFFRDQKFTLYKVKETIFMVNLVTGRTDLVAPGKSFDCREDGSFFITKKMNTVYLFGINENKDVNIKKSRTGFHLD